MMLDLGLLVSFVSALVLGAIGELKSSWDVRSVHGVAGFNQALKPKP